MDRNVFALIAGTIFLLFIINAVVQMQTAMVREAAGGISADYTEATWETAGMMYILSNDNAESFGHYTDEQDLDNALDKVGSHCTVDGAPFFKNGGPLEVAFYNSVSSVDKSMDTDCVEPDGWVRSAPLRVTSYDFPLWIGVNRDE